MEKRHRRGLSKQAVSDSCFGSLVLICFLEFRCQLKRAGGRAASPQLAPPCVENLGLVFRGGWGDHVKIPPLDFVV